MIHQEQDSGKIKTRNYEHSDDSENIIALDSSTKRGKEKQKKNSQKEFDSSREFSEKKTINKKFSHTTQSEQAIGRVFLKSKTVAKKKT